MVTKRAFIENVNKHQCAATLKRLTNKLTGKYDYNKQNIRIFKYSKFDTSHCIISNPLLAGSYMGKKFNFC